MAEYFQNVDDLTMWVKKHPSPEVAAKEIMTVINKPNIPEEQSIVDSCKGIFGTEDLDDPQSAAFSLFGILANHNLTTIKKQSEGNNKMKMKIAKKESRQRNDWVRGERNKWNRCVNGFNEGTPWRTERDKMYNFTHYYTDAVQFDEDPSHVYSGEAIWRAYVMDKFSSETLNEKGKWVGGYVQDRFYMFPDAGTPDNPDVPRDGGNQMGLAPHERTRLPRPHQYSTERRLEEARGNKTKDITLAASSGLKKIASIDPETLPKERHSSLVYNVFRDSLDMRDSGIEYTDMLQKISGHYGISLTSASQIDAVAQNLKTKHDGVGYGIPVKSNPVNPVKTEETEEDIGEPGEEVGDETGLND